MPDTTLISGDRTRTSADLDTRAMMAAEGFRRLGVGRSDTIALLLRNDFAFFEASKAATLIGASPVAVNWHLAPPEVGYVLEDCGAKVLVAHTDLLALLGDAVPDGLKVLSAETPPEIASAYRLSGTAGSAPPGTVSWDTFVTENPPLRDPCRDFTDTMTYTSGTTGKPKGVRRFPQDPETAARFLTLRDRLYGIRPGIRALICGPLYHAAPNAFGLRAIAAAQTVVMMPRFDPELFLAQIERHRITTMFMVPTMFIRLLKLPDEVRARYDVSSLKHVLIAAAPCPAEVKSAMTQWFGPIIHEFFGGTESSYVSACTPQDSMDKPGSVGKLMDGVTVRIVDEDGHDVAPGTPGEILTRLDIAPEFTYANREEDRAALDHDGLIATGDVGYLDADGYLFLCDRRRDMVISGGVNIYPAEIEAELHTLPGILDCAVFGIPDAEFGETLLAVVQPQQGADLSADQIIARLKDRLAAFKIPRRIEFHNDLPRDDAGKIYKRRLRDPYWQAAKSEPVKATG